MSKFMLNMNKVNEEAKKLNSGGIYFSRKAIPANSSVDLRIMPPLRSLNGNFYLLATTVWMNNRPYLSPRTFGEACPILDFIDAAKKDGTNQDVLSLIGSDKFSVNEDVIMPILLLNVKYDGPEVSKVEVIDDEVKIFDCTTKLAAELTGYVSSRHYQKGADHPLGIFDPKVGHIITVSKTVKENNTSYTSQIFPLPTELPEKYYEDVPDVVAKTREKLYSNAYLEGAVANFFFGDKMPDDSLKRRPASENKVAVVEKEEAPKETVTDKVPEKVVEKEATPTETSTDQVKEAAPDGGTILDRLRNNS